MVSKSKKWNKEFGGEWKWNGLSGWDCDDGRRIVRTSGCDIICDGCGSCRTQLWLYEEGKEPIRI